MLGEKTIYGQGMFTDVTRERRSDHCSGYILISFQATSPSMIRPPKVYDRVPIQVTTTSDSTVPVLSSTEYWQCFA
jgi:hypothetical protein